MSVFVLFENKEKYSIYVCKKYFEENHVNLLLKGEEGTGHYVRIKDFNTEEILKCHINDCFKINGKKMAKMSKKGEFIKFNNYERKVKSAFMIYADFKSIPVPEDNDEQNPDESYTNKYQKQVAINYGYNIKFWLYINMCR